MNTNRTNRLFAIGLTLVALLNALTGCVMQDIREVSTDRVYFTFNIGSTLGKRKALRAHDSEKPQINQDITDKEDTVDRLAVFVFPVNQENLTAAAFASSTSAKLKIEKPGRYDFYFIANYNSEVIGSSDNLEELKTRNQVEEYLKKERQSLTKFFSGTIEGTPYIPMSRVYYDQEITEGGTYMAPIPFHPTVSTNQADQLKPVSSFGGDYEYKTKQETVNLIRAFSKLTFTLKGDGVKDIKEVKYHNMANGYTFMELNAKSYGSGTPQSFSLPESDKRGEEVTLRTYVPERIFQKGTSWQQYNINGINYITIEMQSGKTYEIPMITNTDVIDNSYMSVAKGEKGSAPDYSVIRNHHYKYTIKVPQDGKDIGVDYQVNPWNRIQSEMSYTRPAYEIKIIQANQELKNIDNEISLRDTKEGQPSSVSIEFKIIKPKGALWAATITNGRDFELSGDYTGIAGSNVDGIVTGEGEWHKMTLKPRRPFDKEPKFTQFYIVVEGKEIYLGFDKEGKPVNQFIGDGNPGKWMFRQDWKSLENL